jgi:hypothetical protein
VLAAGSSIFQTRESIAAAMDRLRSAIATAQAS